MSGEPSPGHEVWATVVQAPEGIVGFWLFVLLQLEFNQMATCDVLVAAGLELGGYVQIIMAMFGSVKCSRRVEIRKETVSACRQHKHLFEADLVCLWSFRRTME